MDKMKTLGPIPLRAIGQLMPNGQGKLGSLKGDGTSCTPVTQNDDPLDFSTRDFSTRDDPSRGVSAAGRQNPDAVLFMAPGSLGGTH